MEMQHSCKKKPIETREKIIWYKKYYQNHYHITSLNLINKTIQNTNENNNLIALW